MEKTLIFCLLMSLIVFTSCRKSDRFNNKTYDKVTDIVQVGIRDRVSDQAVGGDRTDTLAREIEQFYRERDFEPAWLTVDEPYPMVEGLKEAIGKSPGEGLDPEDYNLEAIQELQHQVYADSVPERVAGNLAALDVLMTDAYMRLGSHLLSGKIDPEKADSNWQAYPVKQDLSKHLSEALRKKDIIPSLFSLAPDNRQYRQLKAALAFYRDIEAKGGWDRIPDASATEAIRQRLAVTGDLDETSLKEHGDADPDDVLLRAVRQFQMRHGIEGNGELTPATLDAMNVPVTRRIEQIALNMQRLRWLPDSLGENYLLVNIPEYTLRVYEEKEKVMEMRVIVGEVMHATPVFSDTMEYIVFNPTWTVPLSIARKEFLPKLKDDAEEFLEKGNYVLYESWDKNARQVTDVKEIDWKDMEEEDFTFKLVEAPGRTNSLGRIKFMFPNDQAIYLHDTPAGHLFDNSERDFSHGCIRVEQPLALAKYLLQDEEWEDKKIAELMEKEEPVNVELPEKLPVHIVYHSAWVDERGLLNFRKDIYQHDRTQEIATEKKSTGI